MERRTLLVRTSLATVLVGLAALAWWAGMFGGPPAAGGLSRRDALLGLLTLGVFSLAIYGFDLRDWF